MPAELKFLDRIRFFQEPLPGKEMALQTSLQEITDLWQPDVAAITALAKQEIEQNLKTGDSSVIIIGGPGHKRGKTHTLFPWLVQNLTEEFPQIPTARLPGFSLSDKYELEDSFPSTRGVAIIDEVNLDSPIKNIGEMREVIKNRTVANIWLVGKVSNKQVREESVSQLQAISQDLGLKSTVYYPQMNSVPQELALRFLDCFRYPPEYRQILEQIKTITPGLLEIMVNNPDIEFFRNNIVRIPGWDESKITIITTEDLPKVCEIIGMRNQLAEGSIVID